MEMRNDDERIRSQSILLVNAIEYALFLRYHRLEVMKWQSGNGTHRRRPFGEAILTCSDSGSSKHTAGARRRISSCYVFASSIDFYFSDNNFRHTVQSCYVKSKSYAHNHLKCFKAFQYFMPVVKRLHPFDIPMVGTRNGRIAKSDACFLWRICPVVNMS